MTSIKTPASRFISFIILCYVMAMIFANWFDPRLIHIFGLDTDAGTLIFPFTFLLSDLITEVYGYKQARRAIWAGFLFNALFICYGQIVIHLPSPNYPTNNALFDQILSLNYRIIIASAISYFCSEPLNSLTIAKLKIKMRGRLVGIRFILSTFIASGFDSLIFGTIAFYGMISSTNLISLILTMWLIKVAIETIGLPVSVHLAKKLKHLEQTDVYDNQTKFNIFSLDGVYALEANHYK